VNNVKKLAAKSLMIIILLSLFASTMSAAGATESRVEQALVKNSHIIQVFQLVESPEIIVFQETMSFNNTSDNVYTGTILFSIMDPMYVNVLLNSTIELTPWQISDGLFAVELSGNNSIEPSQVFNIFVEYAKNYPEDETDNMRFQKEMQYNTQLIMLIVRPITGFIVVGEGIELSKATTAEFEGAWISPHFEPVSAQPGDKFGAVLTKSSASDSLTRSNDDSSNIPLYIMIILIASVIIVFAVVLYSRRKNYSPPPEAPARISKHVAGRKTAASQEPKSGGATTAKKRRMESVGDPSLERMAVKKRQKLIAEKKKLLEAKKQIKSWNKTEKLSDDEFTKMDEKYKQKIKDTNKKIKKLDKQIESGRFDRDGVEPVGKSTGDEKELNVLIARKKTLLSVIKNLEKDYESGTLPDDVYEELKAEYKQEAIEVLKKIDDYKD
jgi:hypothetical protein